MEETTQMVRMKPYVNKLLTALGNQGIIFRPSDDPRLNNIILTKGDKELVIANHCFYGYSRMGCVVKEIKNTNNVEFVPVTDDMYMNIHMKRVIENFFNK